MPYLATIGTFDGVHRGHRVLLRRLIRQSKKLKLRTLVILFSEPPRSYFHPEQATPLITLPSERERLLNDVGVDRVRILRFGKFWAEMSHVDFFERFLLKQCRIKGLVIGPDFAFGKGRLGSVLWLQQACRKHHIHMHVERLLMTDAIKVSSTRIRELLLQGDVDKAGRLLGRPYLIEGEVIRGRGLGGRIGVPTANLLVDRRKLLPRGVYKVRVRGLKTWSQGRTGVCNIGTRPTVDGTSQLHVEVHIPRFSGDLYGRTLQLEFLKHLRAEKKFPSVDALRIQIHRDIRRALHH